MFVDDIAHKAIVIRRLHSETAGVGTPLKPNKNPLKNHCNRIDGTKVINKNKNKASWPGIYLVDELFDSVDKLSASQVDELTSWQVDKLFVLEGNGLSLPLPPFYSFYLPFTPFTSL